MNTNYRQATKSAAVATPERKAEIDRIWDRARAANAPSSTPYGDTEKGREA